MFSFSSSWEKNAVRHFLQSMLRDVFQDIVIELGGYRPDIDIFKVLAKLRDVLAKFRDLGEPPFKAITYLEDLGIVIHDKADRESTSRNVLCVRRVPLDQSIEVSVHLDAPEDIFIPIIYLPAANKENIDMVAATVDSVWHLLKSFYRGRRRSLIQRYISFTRRLLQDFKNIVAELPNSHLRGHTGLLILQGDLSSIGECDDLLKKLGLKPVQLPKIRRGFLPSTMLGATTRILTSLSELGWRGLCQSILDEMREEYTINIVYPREEARLTLTGTSRGYPTLEIYLGPPPYYTEVIYDVDTATLDKAKVHVYRWALQRKERLLDSWQRLIDRLATHGILPSDFTILDIVT